MGFARGAADACPRPCGLEGEGEGAACLCVLWELEKVRVCWQNLFFSLRWSKGGNKRKADTREASKDSCKKSLSQDSLTLEELSSRLTGLVKGFATEEAAREYSRAWPSIIGRQARAPLALRLLHRPRLAAVRIMEEQANSARLARASESPADSAASGSPSPLELAPFLGV